MSINTKNHVDMMLLRCVKKNLTLEYLNSPLS